MTSVQMGRAWPWVLAASLVGVFVPALAFADWGVTRGQPGSTNRAGGVGSITSAPADAPGIAWSVTLDGQPLSTAMLRDLDEDGLPEILFVAGGRVWALSPQLGGPLWASPALSLDGIIGFAELDGDAGLELVASAGATAGGFMAIEPATGALLGSIGSLPTLSGVVAHECAIADLDGDGIDEIVHPPGRAGVAEVWVSNLAAGFAGAGFLSVPLGGYNVTTPAYVGDFLGTGAPVVLVDQAQAVTLYPSCAPTAPDARCDDASGGVCLCAPLAISGIHATYSFGPRWVVDADDDGRDELVQVGNAVSYLKAISVLDMVDGLATSPPSVIALRQWYRRYMALSPVVRLEPLQEGPLDLDGDGDLEIVVSFHNNTGDDTDATGAVPNEDGIDHPGGVSVGVFDLATGELLASLLDAFAWGTADLDGDGIVELVTSPTSAFTFQAGLNGVSLDCSTPNCAFQPMWSAPTRTLHPQLFTYSDTALPPARLSSIDADLDGTPDLLAFNGSVLEALGGDGVGGVLVLGSRALVGEETLIAADPVSNTVAISSETEVSVLGAGLAAVGLPASLPSTGWDRVYAVDLVGDGRDVPIFSGRAFVSELEPDNTSQADFETLPGFVLGEDLDGDGAAEVLSAANPGSLENDDESFELRLDRWDPGSGAPLLVWQFDSADTASLLGFRVGSALHAATGDFVGSSSRDIVLEVVGAGVYRYIVIDGETGALGATFVPTERVATSSTLYVLDLVDASGGPNADGVDELLIDGANLLSLHSVAQGPLWSLDVGAFIHGIGALVDVDDDGDVELLCSLSVTSNNRMELIDDLGSGAPSSVWGPLPLGLPTDQAQVLAVADLDALDGDDIIYITGDGGVHGFSGTSGAAISTSPVYVSGGSLTTDPPLTASNLLSLVSFDIDGDGYEEAVVGAADGWIYAVNLAEDDPGAGTLEWSFAAAAAVRALGAADTDGDGFDELLVSTDDGQGSVLDGAGVAIEITSPLVGECVPSSNFTVTGTAVALPLVDVQVAGASVSGDVDSSSGSWQAAAQVRGAGTFVLTARGKYGNGTVAATASQLIQVGADADGDGWFACADCDEEDSGVHPGAKDPCEDGIDQDCDGQDTVCAGDDDDDSGGDDDDSGGDDDDDDSAGEPGGGCGGGCAGEPGGGCGGGCAACSSTQAGSARGSAALTLCLACVLWSRRSRHPGARG